MKQKILVSLVLALIAFGAVLFFLFSAGKRNVKEIGPGEAVAPTDRPIEKRSALKPAPAQVEDPTKTKAAESSASLPQAANPTVIAGRVISAEDAAPLAGVVVRATFDAGRIVTEPAVWDLDAITDAQGRFELRELAFSPYRVRASMDGMLAAEVDGVFPGEPVELKLAKQEAIRCTLVLDGEDGLMPLPSQVVSISIPGAAWSFEGESASDGSLALTGIRREDLELARKGHQVECVVPGFAEATFAAVPPGDAYRISVETGATVDGSVLDAKTKRPIPGAKVHADSGCEVTADENGRYRISGVGDDLTAYAQGYAFETTDIDADEPGQVIRHDFRLKRGLAIHGKVKDSSGKPLQGFRISLPIDAIDLESSSEKLEGRLIDSYATVSGPGGEYRLEGLNPQALSLPGDLELTVKAPGSASSFVHEVEGVSAAGDDLEQDIVLDLQLVLEGTLRQSNGEPISSVAVYLEAIDSDFLLASGTSAQGTFALKNVPSDRYRLRFERSGRVIHVQEIDVPTSPLEIRITELGLVEGLLYAADSREPLNGAQVSLLADSRGRVTLASGVPTDAAGRFRLEDVPQGEYKLVVKQDPRTAAFSRFEPSLEFPVTVGAQGWTGNLSVPVLPSGEVAFSFSLAQKPGVAGAPVTASVWIAILSVRGADKSWTAPSGVEPILVEDAQQGYRARWRAGEYKLRFSTTVEGRQFLKEEAATVTDGAAQDRAIAFTR